MAESLPSQQNKMAGPKKPVVLLCPTSWKGREVLRPLFRKHGWDVTEVIDSSLTLVWEFCMLDFFFTWAGY